MAEQLELLNSESHRDVRMRLGGIDPHPHFVMVVPEEFAAAAAVCPIFFAKSADTGEFYAAALLGFQPGELLVEVTAQGQPVFQPLEMQRQGFFTAEADIAIDLGHPRFGAGASVALFEDDGTPSNAMRKVQRALGELVRGVEASRALVRELMRLKLIEPIDIALQFDDGQRLTLDGLYTVSRDALAELDDAEVLALFRSGQLQAALCVSGSLSQVPLLARRRNERLTAA
ncbi:SapC family protein [Sphingomonas hengshuiensis]|uniref:Multidrug transporter n=1 Tax=Sphingomonas hengshuiensis TaxID=1609977 RepID=A0A7U4J943_9SPHN|nr:SapC family protein [Sphingomonas hengshuiensis]AJP72514.1 hypothetical protein TS85_13090 [Sphingomonas hengshuiensis]